MTVKEQTHFGRAGDFLTLRHLVINGTNFEIGRKLGDLAKDRYGKSSKDFVADPLFARARKEYFRRNYPIHWERVRGVAAAFGIDPTDDRYDLTGLPYGMEMPGPPPGCSVVYYPPSSTVEGSGYLSRNYDFSIGTIADLMQIPLPPETTAELPRVMGEPYLMEWYPEDGGFNSVAIHGFDTLSGTLDGINSAGLVVSILAEDDVIESMGPTIERHTGMHQAVGLHELQVMRLLLDTSATVEEAKTSLLGVKQYYSFAPCHYIIADSAGNSFVYENSIGRNVQHVIDGKGRPQVVTNFQLYRNAASELQTVQSVSIENEALWRYQTLSNCIADHRRQFTSDEIKANNASVNIHTLIESMRSDPERAGVAASAQARTLWHSLYNQKTLTAEISFYLGETVGHDGTRTERRSDYLKFALDRGSAI